MRYRAIFFDLYGTLVDDLRYPRRQELKYRRWKSKAAAILRVPVDDFTRVWSETVPHQSVGKIAGGHAPYEFICDTLDIDVAEDELKHAAEVGLEYVRYALKPREGTDETLGRLRDAGIKVGLISNCLGDTSELWPSTRFAQLFDASILSFDVGLVKPDPRIYHLACERLEVDPRDCLFIGDGGSGELTGASKVGMDVVLIRAPYDTESGDREDWRGARISSVAEVLTLVE
ncbi:MAG: HAD family hydrolase [Chloroflexi bacterium]|nr:HAD family hydrolase [Chloroflexota bacterium]